MANIFEFLSKDGNITPEKARKSSLSMRSFAIEEPGSPVPALYATLHLTDLPKWKKNHEKICR